MNVDDWGIEFWMNWGDRLFIEIWEELFAILWLGFIEAGFGEFTNW